MLTKRQSVILRYLINDYAQSGEPVGSKALCQELPFPVSSATVRNDLAVLSDLGLLTQPHPSSGRIPSNEGYRYYIDNLVYPQPIDEESKNLIHSALNGAYQQIDDLVKEAAEILSTITDYTALSLSPEQAEKETLKHFQLLRINDHQVLAIMSMNNDQVETQPFVINQPINDGQLEQITNLVNDKLGGKAVAEIMKALETSFSNDLRRYLSSSEDVTNALSVVLAKAVKDHFYVSGRMNLLTELDDIEDVAKIKPLFSLFGEETRLDDFLDDTAKPMSVKLGSEFDNKLLKDFSVISGNYSIGNRDIGQIAVIGPTRMPYGKVLGIIQEMRQELTKALNNYFDKYSD